MTSGVIGVAHTGPGTPILVCGGERSGTTLLTALLDGHSQVLVFPVETFFFERYRECPNRSIGSWVEELVESQECRKLVWYGRRSRADGQWSDFDYAGFIARFRSLALSRGRPAGVLPSLLEAYGYVSGQGCKRYWLEKTPWNEFSLVRAARWYAGLRALYVLRDPRAVYCSVLRKAARESGGVRTVPVVEFMSRWARSLLAWEQFVASGGNGLLVRYEDLASDPRASMARICSFLDIPYEPVLERPLKGGEPFSGNSSFSETLDGISREPVDRWRQLLPPDVAQGIESWVRPVLARSGYECSRTAYQGWATAGPMLLRHPARRRFLGLWLARYQGGTPAGRLARWLLSGRRKPPGE
jgi:hypothetical protein